MKTVKEILQRTKQLFDMMAKAENEDERRAYRNEVIEMNIRLVPHMLKKYKPYTEDTYQDGCIGLLRATEEYDSSKRVPFVNFACLCIEREIQLAWKYKHRKFEGKMQQFLSSLDDQANLQNGDEVNPYERIADPNAEVDFNQIFEAEGLDELFYDVIIPSIEKYGVRAKNLDLERWKELEIRYFLELSAEQSQRQRLTFTAIAQELNTTTQNIRTRHKKVVMEIQTRCNQLGIYC